MEIVTDYATGYTTVQFPDDPAIDSAFGEMLCTLLRKQPGVQLASHSTSISDGFSMKLRLDDPAAAKAMLQAAFRQRALDFQKIIDSASTAFGVH